MKPSLRQSLGASVAALLASSATLACCVLPAIMVALGAGAVLAGLLSAVPQLVWLSEHKALVFGLGGAMLVIGGWLLKRASALPCPAEPAAAAACIRLRRWSSALYWSAVVAYVVGGAFVLIAPAIARGDSLGLAGVAGPSGWAGALAGGKGRIGPAIQDLL